MYIADYTNIFMKICHAIAGFRLNVKKQHPNRKCFAQGGQFWVITNPLCWSILG
jgi:hypothetical protein